MIKFSSFVSFNLYYLFIYIKEHHSAIDEYFNSTQTPAKGKRGIG